MTPSSIDLSRSRNSISESFWCRIRPFPTLISKKKRNGLGLYYFIIWIRSFNSMFSPDMTRPSWPLVESISTKFTNKRTDIFTRVNVIWKIIECIKEIACILFYLEKFQFSKGPYFWNFFHIYHRLNGHNHQLFDVLGAVSALWNVCHTVDM